MTTDFEAIKVALKNAKVKFSEQTDYESQSILITQDDSADITMHFAKGKLWEITAIE